MVRNFWIVEKRWKGKNRYLPCLDQVEKQKLQIKRSLYQHNHDNSRISHINNEGIIKNRNLKKKNMNLKKFQRDRNLTVIFSYTQFRIFVFVITLILIGKKKNN